MAHARLLITLAVVVGCGGAINSQGDGSPDAGPDGEQGVCCPPDPEPGCCMHYGGWASSVSQCFDVCDGMPVPSDPSWQLVKDANGCSMWTSSPGGAVCGQGPIIDAGNPPGCPPSFEDGALCGAPCSAVGTSCSYTGGDSMSCYAAASSDGGGSRWGCGV